MSPQVECDSSTKHNNTSNPSIKNRSQPSQMNLYPPLMFRRSH